MVPETKTVVVALLLDLIVEALRRLHARFSKKSQEVK